MLRKWAAVATGVALALFARFLTAARAIWDGTDPVARQRIYFANHTSNGDFMLIWTVLPPPLRRQTRPVAAADYWLKNKAREFIGRDVVNAVLVDRRAKHRDSDPIEAMVEALDDGASLIIFPEGKRNTTGAPLLPFKAGLYNMAKARPEIDLVPVWIENLNNVMPKGEVIPIPLICTVTFGASIHVGKSEGIKQFLKRAEAALLALDTTEGGRS